MKKNEKQTIIKKGTSPIKEIWCVHPCCDETAMQVTGKCVIMYASEAKAMECAEACAKDSPGHSIMVSKLIAGFHNESKLEKLGVGEYVKKAQKAAKAIKPIKVNVPKGLQKCPTKKK